MTNKLSFTLILFLLIVAAAVLFGFKNFQNIGSQPVSNIEQQIVESAVKGFGSRLKSVSLLSPSDVLATSMDKEYGDFVSKELISEWKKDPSAAIGRNVSSPWPEEIRVVTIDQLSYDKYSVTGNVVEVNSDYLQTGEIASVYPVKIQLEKKGGKWLITQLAKGAYSTIPEKTTLKGVYTCLPHRESKGPQTTECALGIKTDNGVYYAMDTNLIQSKNILSSLTTGDRIQIDGPIVPVEQLNSDSWQKYDIHGIISVTGIHKL